MQKWRIKLFIIKYPDDCEEYDNWIEVELPDDYEPMYVASREKVS